MGWRDNLQPASFREIEFETKFVTLEGGKKGGKNDRPKRKGGSTEDLGNKINIYLVEGYLWGDDYVEKRRELQDALDIKGSGELILPTYGSIESLPVSWSFSENVDEEGGFVRFNIEFQEQIFPNIPQVAISKAESSIVFQPIIVELSAENYINQIDLNDTSIFERALTDLQSSVLSINAAIKGVVADVNDSFNELVTVIDSTMDEVLLANPLTILTNIQQLINLPATIKDKFDVLKDKYKNIIENTLDVFPFASISNKSAKTQCVHAELIVGSAISSLVGSAANSSFKSRSDILSANDLISTLFDTYVERLGEYTALFTSSGPFYETLAQDRFVVGYDVLSRINTIISDSSTSLVERSFQLPTETQIILDRERTLLGLAFDLYGNIEKVDELIDINSINDPFLLSRGMKIIYYA